MTRIENMPGAGSGPDITPTTQASTGAVEQKTTTPQISSGAAMLRSFGAVTSESPTSYIPRSAAFLSQLGAITKKENPDDYISTIKAEARGPEGFKGEIPDSAIILKDMYLQEGLEVPKYVEEAAEKRKEWVSGTYRMVEYGEKYADLDDEELKRYFGSDDKETDEQRLMKYKQLLSYSEPFVRRTLNPEKPDDQKELDMVLHYVMEDICRTYEAVRIRTEPVRKLSTSEEYYHTEVKPKSVEERVKIVEDMLLNYEDRFWEYGEATLKKVFGDKVKNLKTLRSKYEGAASYVARRVGAAIIKELKGGVVETEAINEKGQIDRSKIYPTKAEFGDFYLLKAKQALDAMSERDREIRRKARQRVSAYERLRYNDWRERFDFKWAETVEELDDSLEDYLDFFQQAFPEEAEDKVYEYVTAGARNVISALDQAFDRIGIPFHSEAAYRLREKAHGHIETIAGARLLEAKGGLEYYIKLRRDFASNYEGYYNRIYLREGFAYTGRAISRDNGAIYKGGPENINKPLAGHTLEHRKKIREQIIRDSIDYELYVTRKDMEEAIKGEEKIRKDVEKLHLPPEEAEKIIQTRLEEKMGRYGWGEDDLIEKLMLKDERGWKKAREIAPNDPNNAERKAAEARVKTRTELFQKMKRDLDKEDIAYIDNNGKKVSLADLNEDQRKAVVRQRIEEKMKEEKASEALLKEINAVTEEEAHKQGFVDKQAYIDHALWKWVKEYNVQFMDYRPGPDAEAWFPSIWDRERLLVRDAEDLIDRALEEQEFDAMYEKVDDVYKDLTDKQLKDKVRAEVKEKLAAVGKTLSEEGINQAVGEKMADIKFEIDQREKRAKRNFSLNVAQDKFLGLQARFGGLTSRVIDEKTGGTKLVTIYELAEQILKFKIDKEEAEVEAKVERWARERAAAGATVAQIEARKVKQRRLFRRHCTFAAVLGLRELKIAKDLPLYNLSYYSDVSQIGAFAPLVGYTDDEKDKLVEILERPRREAQAVFSFLAAMHMDGRMLVIKNAEEGDEWLVIEDEEGKQKPAQEAERVRPRVINEGGVLKLRDIFESPFMISTSGGVKVPDLIAKMAWLGVYDELYENGCKDKLQWQSFRRRRNKWELREQSFFNIREWYDPLTYVDRLEGANNARKLLVGGEIRNQGDQPGVLNETLKGAWRMRRAFLQSRNWVVGEALNILSRSKGMKDIEDIKKELRQVLEGSERVRNLTPTGRDELVELAGDVISYLRLYLKSRDYQRNKGGYASHNWHYDNELIAQAYLKELAKRESIVAKRGQFLGWDENGQQIIAEGGEILNIEEGEALGGQGQAFAVQGRTQLAQDIYESTLRGSTYELPDENLYTVINIQSRQARKKLNDKKQEFVNELLSPMAQTALKAARAKLKHQEWVVNGVEQKFAAVFAPAIDEGKLRRYREELNKHLEPEKEAEVKLEIGQTLHTYNSGQIKQYRAELEKETATQVALEFEINKAFNQAVQAKLEAEVNAGRMTWKSLLDQIKARRQYLDDRHVEGVDVEWEINRVINYYLDTEVHKQVVGEWGAVLAPAALDIDARKQVVGEWGAVLAPAA